MRRQIWWALASLTIIAVASACDATRPVVEPPIEDSPGPRSLALFATPEPRPQATVVDLVDGDTIVLALEGSEVRVRLVGIDAPEADLDQCFGTAAAAFVAAVASPGATLEVERDVSDVDAFGRLLRYVYLPDGSMLNERLVRGGFARVDHVPPDGKYRERLRDAEDAARRDGVGLWSECEATPVAAVQAATPPPPVATAAAVVATTATPTPTPPPPTEAPTQTPAPTPTPAPTATPTVEPTAAPPPPTPTPDPRAGCDPSYPTVCIPPSPPDLDCGEIPFRRFTVLQPDPHRFDRDKDGIGCES